MKLSEHVSKITVTGNENPFAFSLKDFIKEHGLEHARIEHKPGQKI